MLAGMQTWRWPPTQKSRLLQQWHGLIHWNRHPETIAALHAACVAKVNP
jgi:hypothetical protein